MLSCFVTLTILIPFGLGIALWSFFGEKTYSSAPGLWPFSSPPEKAQAPQSHQYSIPIYSMPPPTQTPLIPDHIVSQQSFVLSLLSWHAFHFQNGGVRELEFILHEWVKSLSHVGLFATPWTVAYQVPPSMGFSRQECWSGLPFPSPGDLLDPGIEPGSPTLQADALPSEPPGKPSRTLLISSVFFPPPLLCCLLFTDPIDSPKYYRTC